MTTGRLHFSILLSLFLLFSFPLTTAAQTTGPGTSPPPGGSPLGGSSPGGSPAGGAPSTTTRQQFTPGASAQNGNSFGGLQFSGVGGALAGCLDVGGLVMTGINDLFNLGKSAAGMGGESVPVKDAKAIEQQKKANQRDACLDGLAYAVAKGLLQQITNKTLNWVNTGLDGNPLYVKNINSFMENIDNEQIKEFLGEIPNQNPIFGNAIRSILTQQVSGLDDGLLGQTMDTPEGRAYESFQQDFSNGGWAAFLNPRNNPIGVILETSDTLSRKISSEKQNIQNQLQRNDGFLDLTTCVKYGTPGINANPKDLPCLEKETTMPGSTIAARLVATITSDIRQLEQADEINEVLGGFFQQLLNNLFSGGFKKSKTSNMLGITLTGAGAASGGSTQTTAGGGTGVNTSDFDISRPQHLRSVLQVQYDYLNRAEDAHVALQRIVPTLGALDYCLPGPNPTWKEGLNENADIYFGSLQEVQKDTSTFTRILQTIPILGGFFGGGQSHTIAAVGVSFFDKASGQNTGISDTVFYERNRSTLAIFENVQLRYKEVTDFYETNYTKEAVRNAFLTADPGNASFTSGFVDDAFQETASLPLYSQNINASGLNGQYTNNKQAARDAIRELESIRSEVNSIVTTAKARYIAEQSAAGTPVNRNCLDVAYVIDNTPIIPVARQEAATPSPFSQRSSEANTFFYSQL